VLQIPRPVLREDGAVAKKQGIKIRVRLTIPEGRPQLGATLLWRTNGEMADLRRTTAGRARVAGTKRKWVAFKVGATPVTASMMPARKKRRLSAAGRVPLSD
jgi:hypothetical protein